jgi:hypothetical protein
MLEFRARDRQTRNEDADACRAEPRQAQCDHAVADKAKKLKAAGRDIMLLDPGDFLPGDTFTLRRTKR